MGRVDGKRVAYTTNLEAGKWEVVICIKDENGYRPIPDYGPYDDEARAEMIAKNLNKRLGIDEVEVRDVVRSTMPKCLPIPTRAQWNKKHP